MIRTHAVAYLGFGKKGGGMASARSASLQRLSGGEALSRVQGQSPWSGGQGGKAPLKLKHFFAFERSIEAANSPIFLLKFAGERQKRIFSYKVACKKFSWSGQRGGASHRGPPPKYSTACMTLSFNCRSACDELPSSEY